MFKSAKIRLAEERAERPRENQILKFGISFLDASCRGILPKDLVLLGAPTGQGKTDICVMVALKNLAQGKRVHFIALEAERNEIERRLLYTLTAHNYFQSHDRPNLGGHLNMTDWLLGKFDEAIEPFENMAREMLSPLVENLFTFYKANKFKVEDLVFNVGAVAHQTDLIIVDHVHVFDWDDDNDNRAIKEIAKTSRDVVLEMGTPMILVAHLRKKDRASKELVPGYDEFHGSSDLTKLATKVITLAPGQLDEDGKSITYFRVCKNRIDGSICRFIARTKFDFKKRCYDEKFKLAPISDKFEELGRYPFWAEAFRDNAGRPMGGMPDALSKRKPYADD